MPNSSGIDIVNSSLGDGDSEWRMVGYDHASASFRKGDGGLVVRLPFDALMACSSVTTELDEVLAVAEGNTRVG